MKTGVSDTLKPAGRARTCDGAGAVTPADVKVRPRPLLRDAIGIAHVSINWKSRA